MKPMRIYADSTVIGGCIDADYATDSLRLMEAVRRGRLVLLLSDVVVAELAGMPARAVSELQSVPVTGVERVELTEDVMRLRDAYLGARIFGQLAADDATNVAAATVAGADAMVSWDFENLVRLDRMKACNEVNGRRGYGMLTFVIPKAVVNDEKTTGGAYAV